MSESDKRWSVYKLTNKANGKVYIGITGGNPEYRWANGKKYKANKHLTSAIDEYGWDGFKHEVLCTGLTKEQAMEEEVCLICGYRSADREFGYNISLGGVGCTSVSEETREKMRKSATGERNANYGKPKSEETLKCLSESQKKYWAAHPKPTGWKHTEEARRKIGEKSKGRKARLGMHNSEKHNEALRKANSKAVRCVETGVIYESAKIASVETGACRSTICVVCKHKPNRTAGGYHWEFVE